MLTVGSCCLHRAVFLCLLAFPQEVLQNLYRTKSFLFVGCGETLRDQIFQALFLYSVPNKVDLEHYMVVLKENEDHFFKHQADMLLHGIKVVSYGDCFDLFPGYVQDLATQICKQRSPGVELCHYFPSVIHGFFLQFFLLSYCKTFQLPII